VVAQSAPDGYSLLLGNGSTQVMIPLSSARPAYDPVRDFRAVYRLITSTLAFVVNPSLPVRDLQELAAYANDNPGKISYGTPGVGTGNHLVGEMFRRQSATAVDIVHIPYRGMAPATNDLVSGQIPVMIAVSIEQPRAIAPRWQAAHARRDERESLERRAGNSHRCRGWHAGSQLCRMVRPVCAAGDLG